MAAAAGTAATPSLGLTVQAKYPPTNLALYHSAAGVPERESAVGKDDKTATGRLVAVKNMPDLRQQFQTSMQDHCADYFRTQML